MKAKDIQVGKIYKNSGAGRTQREVLAIGPYHPADMPAMWNSDAARPDAPVVKYRQVGKDHELPVYVYLHSFASWAAGEAVAEVPVQTLVLTNDVQQDATKPETGAVSYMVFLLNGDMRVFDDFAEAQGVAVDVSMNPLSRTDAWCVYPLYAGPAITGS